MRFIFSILSVTLFIAVFIHALFSVTGIAPRTISNINATIMDVVQHPKQTASTVRSEVIEQMQLPQETEAFSGEQPHEGSTTREYHVWDFSQMEPAEVEQEVPVGGSYMFINPNDPGTTTISHDERQYVGEEMIEERRVIAPVKLETFSYGASSPHRITIERAGVEASIVVPPSTDIETLDTYLAQGAVYYPGSAKLGEAGHAFIFGHSSWLPLVRNKNFAIFNNLGDVHTGDLIFIYTTDKTFVYEIVEKRIADANELWVDFGGTTEKMLTISSCNSFGSKHDRVIVEARLVES